MNNKVRMTIHFRENYDADAIEALMDEKFPEADLWPREREVRFAGSAERSQELIRAIETIETHDGIRITTRK